MDEKDIQKKRIGIRIKNLRNELGLTMKEFGKKFDPPASDSIVSRWERGVSIPNPERLQRISELGNISMIYLTTGEKMYTDLSQEERIKADEDNKSFVKNIQIAGIKRLKNELQQIINSELNLVEANFLKNILNFLKFTNTEDVIKLTSIIRSLNRIPEERADDSINQEELNLFLEDELEEIEKFFRKKFFD